MLVTLHESVPPHYKYMNNVLHKTPFLEDKGKLCVILSRSTFERSRQKAEVNIVNLFHTEKGNLKLYEMSYFIQLRHN